MRQTRPVILIGLVGPSGSGKTTVCSYLCSDYAFLPMHVAAPLKLSYCKMFNAPLSHTERPSIDEPKEYLGGVTPRVVLEHLGTRLHEIAPQALPLALEKRVKSAIRNGETRILVDGIRRATEAAKVYELRGECWRLDGTEVDPDKPCDLSQQEARCSAVVPWMETSDGQADLPAIHQLVDELLSNPKVI